MTVASSRPPAMSDVAALAGVSHQTVSRVLNDHPSVRPETRARVLEAIATLGYRRNVAARTLVTRRSGTVGVITSGSALFGPTSTFIAVEHAARERGLFVSVATVLDFTEETVLLALEHFMSQGVDGAVVIAAQDDAIARGPVLPGPGAGGRGGPARPAAGRGPPGGGGPLPRRPVGRRGTCWTSATPGSRTCAGRRTGSRGASASRGWRDVLSESGLEVPDHFPGDWTAERGYEAGRLMVAGELPGAVFAANDQLALGVLHAFTEAGCGCRRTCRWSGSTTSPARTTSHRR